MTDDRYFHDVEEWLEHVKDNAAEIDLALDESAVLVYEWQVSHPSLPDAGEVAIQCLECFDCQGRTMEAGDDLWYNALESFYDGCDWIDGELSDVRRADELQAELNLFTEINTFLWKVFSLIPYQWKFADKWIEKYSIGLGRLQRALTAAEIANQHHNLEDPKESRTVTPMDMEVYSYLSKKLKNARALRVAKEQNPDFDLLEYC
jgi:hypothetical protein